jgi:HK97 gp10 family phage protein
MVSDLNRLEMDLGRASLEVIARTATVVRKTGMDVVRDAQLLCPVDTGNLRSSISVDYDADRLGFEAGPTASYGGFVERGTSRMAPHAYLGPAFDRNVPAAVAALGLLGGSVLE